MEFSCSTTRHKSISGQKGRYEPESQANFSCKMYSAQSLRNKYKNILQKFAHSMVTILILFQTVHFNLCLHKVDYSQSLIFFREFVDVHRWVRREVILVSWLSKTAHCAFHHPYPQALCSLSSFACNKRPRWQPVKIYDRHLQSHGKIGCCEQSIL